MNLLKISFSLALGLLLLNSRIEAQDKSEGLNELDVIHSQGAGGKNNSWIEFSDAPNSLYHFISGKAYPLLEERARLIARLHSLADWQKRQEWIKRMLPEVVGSFPEKSPLNAKITRTIFKDGFRMEHIVYESQPGFYISSTLFIPSGLKGLKKIMIWRLSETLIFLCMQRVSCKS
jgi:hypothetical protein